MWVAIAGGYKTDNPDEIAAFLGQVRGNNSNQENNPDGWLQKMMNFFGFGRTPPKDAEEASEHSNRRSLLLSNNAKVEDNIKTAENIPIAGGLLKISKGGMGTFSNGKDYGSVIGGAASILGDIFGGTAAKSVLRTVNGLKITGFTSHAVERAIERGVKPAAI